MTGRDVAGPGDAPADASADAPAPGGCEQRVRDALNVASGMEGPLGSAVLAWRSEGALADARAWDAAERSGTAKPALLGTIMSVKACIDVEGWVTHGASRVLADSPPATRDASIVALLRNAGATILAQTNMTEFAYSGLGLNPHYGTPRSPLYPSGDRIAGGSSSGAGVTVATNLVDAALGTDTSGSVRIPAAFCGVVGFKPSAGRYPDAGILPLAPSFDVPGLIARSVRLCDTIDASLTQRPTDSEITGVASARFVVPRGFIGSKMDSVVAHAFESTVELLASQGGRVEEKDMSYLAEIGEASRDGSVVSSESFAWHQHYIEQRFDLYDPRVGPRIAAGAKVRAVDYIRAKQRMKRLHARYMDDMRDFDALLTPTVAIEPPRISDVEGDDQYATVNQLTLYFTEMANRIDVPSVSIPVGDRTRGVGIMLTGFRGADVALLALARSVEGAIEAWCASV